MLTGFLYGTTPTEPASFAIASAGLLVVMLIASYIPAHRAAKMPPYSALRCE
jgi:putative ABC transport system permease protein